MIHYWTISQSSLLVTNSKYVHSVTVTPKSGDVALQTAPMLAVANIASTVSIQFGI